MSREPVSTSSTRVVTAPGAVPSTSTRVRIGPTRAEREVGELEVGDDERRPRSRARDRGLGRGVDDRRDRAALHRAERVEAPVADGRLELAARGVDARARSSSSSSDAAMPESGSAIVDGPLDDPRRRDVGVARRGGGAGRSSSSRGRSRRRRRRRARPRSRRSCGRRARPGRAPPPSRSSPRPTTCSVRSAVAIQPGCAAVAASPPPITSTSVASAPARTRAVVGAQLGDDRHPRPARRRRRRVRTRAGGRAAGDDRADRWRS